MGLHGGLLAIVAVLAAPAPVLGPVAREASVDAPAQVCFDRAAWSGRDRDRPCWRIRIYEDGSGVVRAADGRRFVIRSPG